MSAHTFLLKKDGVLFVRKSGKIEDERQIAVGGKI